MLFMFIFMFSVLTIKCPVFLCFNICIFYAPRGVVLLQAQMYQKVFTTLNLMFEVFFVFVFFFENHKFKSTKTLTTGLFFQGDRTMKFVINSDV